MKRIIVSLIVSTMLFSLNAERIVFSYWGHGPRFAAVKELEALYRKKFPDNVLITQGTSFNDYYQKLFVNYETDRLGDVFCFDYKWLDDIENIGTEDLSSYFDIIDITDLNIAVIREFCMDYEKIIGIPLGMNAVGMLYNKDFFERFGIDGNDNWTWEDIIENGKKVHTQDETSYLMYFPDAQWPYFIRTFIKQHSGHNLIGEDGSTTCTVEDLEEVFSYILLMLETSTIPPFEIASLYEYGLPNTALYWRIGKWGMTSVSSSTVPEIEQGSPFELSSMRYPVKEDAKDAGIYIAPSMIAAINSKGKNKKESAELINFLINDSDALNIMDNVFGVPLNRNADDGNDNVHHIVKTALASESEITVSKDTSDEVSAIIKNYVHKVGFKVMSVEEAANECYRALNDAARRLR